MAFQTSKLINGGFAANEAYSLIDDVQYSRVWNTLKFRLVMFKDAGTRQAYGAAQQAFMDAIPGLRSAEGALSALLPTPGELAAQLQAKVAASPAANADLSIAQALVTKAQAQAAAGPIQPISATEPFQVPTELVASMLIDGKPDIAKLYAWVKTVSTDLVGAKDV